MTPSDLETVVARTGHERYRWLTSDANPDAAQREGYRRIVRDMAAGKPPANDAAPARPRAKATMAELRHATKHGSARCWFATKDSACGCSGMQCDLLKRRVDIYDCVRCLKTL